MNMERHSAMFLAILSLVSMQFCHCKTKTSPNDSDPNDVASIGFNLDADIGPTSSLSSPQANQFNAKNKIVQEAKDRLLRSILENVAIEISQYIRVIDAVSNHDTALSPEGETSLDAYAPANAALLVNGDPDQDGVDLMSILKRSSAPAPLRKRQLNALERAVIRQEILRRLEENKNTMEIPIGLRFRRVHGAAGGYPSRGPYFPSVDSFFPKSHGLGYRLSSQGRKHSSWNSFGDMPPYNNARFS